MQPTALRQPPLAGRLYTNVLLTVIALSLGVIALDTVSANPRISGAAWAQPGGDDETGRISAAEQRKQMIAELKSMSARMERMDALLSKGITVKVSEMPRNDPANR